MSLDESIDQTNDQIVEVIGFGRRFVAFVIDGIILWLGLSLLDFGLAAIGTNVYETLSSFLSILIPLAYFAGFWATTGQTPGKMVMGIKVISIEGTPISWGKAILRYIGYVVSWSVFLLGFVWVGFDKKRQGWHDKIASTYVVRKDIHFSATDTITIVPSDTGSSVNLLGLIPIFILGVIVVIALLLLFGPTLANLF
jgi:uncharacterized RDD family membrane protein YckC